ncbi:MAG: hypothetical protein J7L25_02785, partial [Deltaproteobacteria bacterium]|nr:hypothetical protein [Candidatus Tharpella aukensis]
MSSVGKTTTTQDIGTFYDAINCRLQIKTIGSGLVNLGIFKLCRQIISQPILVSSIGNLKMRV